MRTRTRRISCRFPKWCQCRHLDISLGTEWVDLDVLVGVSLYVLPCLRSHTSLWDLQVHQRFDRIRLPTCLDLGLASFRKSGFSSLASGTAFRIASIGKNGSPSRGEGLPFSKRKFPQSQTRPTALRVRACWGKISWLSSRLASRYLMLNYMS